MAEGKCKNWTTIGRATTRALLNTNAPIRMSEIRVLCVENHSESCGKPVMTFPIGQ